MIAYIGRSTRRNIGAAALMSRYGRVSPDGAARDAARGIGLKVLLMQNFQTAATVLTHRLPQSAKPHSQILPQRGRSMTEEQYEQAESFWTRKDEKEKKLSADALYDWIDRFLSSHKVLALATAGEDFVRCTPLEYSWHDGALWIFTEGGLKFRALRENKHIGAAVFETNASFGGLKSLQIEGTAEMVGLFSDEYRKAAEFRRIPLEALQKLNEPMWLLKIVPSEITCLNSDFRKDGYGSRQIYRMTK